MLATSGCETGGGFAAFAGAGFGFSGTFGAGPAAGRGTKMLAKSERTTVFAARTVAAKNRYVVVDEVVGEHLKRLRFYAERAALDISVEQRY